MNNFLQIGTIIYFLSGTLYLTDAFKKFQQPLLLVSLGIITIVYLLYRNKYYFVYMVDFVHIIFTVTLLLSAIYNLDEKNFMGSICMFLIYIIICLILPKIPCYTPIKILDKTINIHIFIFIVSIIIEGISLKSYEGIFGNPNSLGCIAVALLSISLSLLSYKIEQIIKGYKNESKSIFFDAFLVLFWLFFVICSSSRTSFLTAILLIALSLIMISKEILSYNRQIYKKVFIKYMIFTFIIIGMGIIFYKNQFLSEIIQTSILDKFHKKSNDVFDGRSERWILVLEEMSILGHGSKHYKLAPHNTFISILGQYGVISTIIYIIFLLLMLKKSILFKKHNNNIYYKYVPLMSVISFIMMSMSESMMLKTNMLLIYFSLALIRNTYDRRGCV